LVHINRDKRLLGGIKETWGVRREIFHDTTQEQVNNKSMEIPNFFFLSSKISLYDLHLQTPHHNNLQNTKIEGPGCVTHYLLVWGTGDISYMMQLLYGDGKTKRFCITFLKIYLYEGTNEWSICLAIVETWSN
jgi:hypothetical protein